MKAKKIVDGDMQSPNDTIEPIVEKPIKIVPFSAEFGREDLNSLRNKVNEIIDYINKI